MKNLERNTIVKRILAVLLILATILPYFPTSVFAAGETGNSGSASVQFNAKWSSENEPEVGTTNDIFAGNYSFTLNGAPTGFQNVQLLLETDNATGANDIITIREISGASGQTSSGEGFAVVNFGNLNQGQSISGDFGVKFVNSEQATRKLTVTLSGSYTDLVDGTTKALNMKKELTATVTPATVITPYMADITWEDYSYYGQQRYKTPSLNATRHTLYHETYGNDIGFYTSKVVASYPIKISSQEKTQELKLEVKVNRYSADGTNRLDEGCSIDWDGLNYDLGTPTVTDNDDGSRTYTFIKGSDNGYNETTAFKLNKTYNVQVTYTTSHTNPVTETNPEFRTFINFEADLNTVGYKLVKEYNQPLASEKITDNKKLTDTRGINLYSYTPGQDAWISVNASSSTIGNSSKITSDDRDNLKNGETVNVNADLFVKFINGDKNTNQVGKINIAQPKLTYITDGNLTRTINLTADQMKIKKVRKSDLNEYDSEFDDGTNSIAFNSSYTVPSDINVYSIKLNDFVSEEKPSAHYYLDYELNLSEAGLTETEIEKIQSISINFTTSGSTCIQGEDSFIFNREVVMAINNLSYMEMELDGNHNTASDKINLVEQKTIKLKMYRNPDIIKDTTSSRNYVVNSNPVFYVEFPESCSRFEYDIDPDNITMTSSSNIQIDEDNLDLITIGDSDFLVIPCLGTYSNLNDDEVDISITYGRKLLDASSTVSYINTYMITDNENYFRETSNDNDFSNVNGETPDKAFLTSASFNVVGIKRVEARTEVKTEDNVYAPDFSNGSNNDKTEKGLPLIIGTNKVVTYDSKVTSEGSKVKDAVIISRLPIANNTYIENSNTQLIENDYELPQAFYNDYGNKIDSNLEGQAVPQISLQSLNIVGLYRERVTSGRKQFEEIDQSKYKIYYTTNANASFDTAILGPGENFDSSKFVEYVPGGINTDFANTKNIKVEITDPDLILQSGQSFVFRYTMTMPSQSGMVGAETAVKCTKQTENESSEELLYSPVAYVINGEENATINVQKGFENYSDGIIPVPYGVDSLANIEFKLQYYNNATRQREFLKDSSNNDVVALTDSTGKAVFTNVPTGRYFLVETTTFEQYSGIGNINIINVGRSETIDYRAENRLKRGDITINKKWLGNDIDIGQVTFKVARINASNETLVFPEQTVTTDGNNQAFVLNVPYGTYSITEAVGQKGWSPENMNVTTTVDNPTVSATYNNIPSRATLQIVKTVPRGEKVDGLSFKVTGRGTIENASVAGIDPNSEIIFKIDGDNNPSNVSIEKSEYDSVATITISNLYLGYYSVEEIRIPFIEGTDDVTKYAAVSDSTVLTANGQTATINLINNHKYGKIIINKTAKLKDGANYQTISDIEGFQVRITGHSYYDPATQIDEVITTDEDGYAEIQLEVGEYLATEIPVDGYTAYYGPEGSRTTTPSLIKLKENNQTVTQEIYNEYTGVGYVKVIKSLEGVTDPNEIVGKHIKFAVVGRNIAQQKIGSIIEGNLQGELIEINQVDLENNVAYGISGPISAGGEYELQEVPSSVPDYYDEYEPTIIEVPIANSVDDAKVVNVTNVKSRGDLEIVTTTDPEGGPLTGITYRVTPVKINSNATYTATGESQIVEGSNESTNPSFAKLENIYAGFYAVEQVTIPEGWKADVKQIVEVPSYNTGYANFEITQKKQVKTNKVTIKKVVLNNEGEIATAENIQDAELNVNESFEVKLTNVDTNEEYFVFTSAANDGVITGLDAGTYRIEEVYKPKYNTLGYYKETMVPDEYDIPRPVRSSLATLNNTFTITEENGVVNDVTLIVENQINTDFGFGGQHSKENLSKLVVEEEDSILVTKAIIYVADEQNNKISGVKFKLFDASNNQITLDKLGSEFEINDYKLIIKGLPAGKYTLKCSQYPEGYLKPDDKEIIVYSDATQVVRVEVQKNVPRGNLTLSTVFNRKNGETRYVTRSEYKVVDSATGELVKFVRTPAGNYKKSNTAEASPIVTLKAAPVELQGLELGDYEVGIVGVRKGYGITKDDPEYVTVEENSNRNVVTTVEDKSIVKVDAHGATTAYLDSNGDLYYIGYLSNSSVYNRDKFTKLYFGENVKIKDFSYITYSGTIRLLAVDEDGHVWAYGTGNTPQLGVMNVKYTNGSTDSAVPPICITKDGDLRDAYASGARFVEAQLCGYYSSTLLDNQGRVWIMGTGCDGNGYTLSTAFAKPIQSFIDNNIKIAKLARNGTTYLTNYGMGCIDTNGKVWIWGGYTYDINNEYNVYAPKCLSDTTDLGNVKIVDLVIRDTVAMALDENGEVWIWGKNDTLQKIVQGGTSTTTPTKIPKSYFQGEKVVGIDLNNGYSDNKIAAVITESGKVFTWGYQSKGELGVGNPGSMSITAPSCLSTGTLKLSGVKITQICIGAGNSNNYPNGASGYTCHVVALDSNNGMWAWGGYSLANEAGQPITTGISAVAYPQRMYTTYDEHLEYNLKFESIAGISTGTSATNYAIDSEGRVWIWGYNASCQLGIQPESTTMVTPTVLEIPGNPKMKKVYNNNYYKAIFLSEDGRVFASGNQVYPGNGSQSLTSSNPLTEITDSCPAGITDIYIWDATIVALDEAGQVWTWGGSGGPMGRTTSATKQIILSDKNIVKISGGSEGALALSSDGKLYLWKNSNSPSLMVSNKDFVDICGLYAIDSEGHLWYCSGYQLVEVDKVTEKMQEDSEYKIEKMLLDLYSYGNQLVYKDSNEDIWSVSGSGTPTKMNFGISGIKALNPSTILTEDGQLWSYNNSTYETNNMMSDLKVKNPFYGKKFKHLYSASYVTANDGKMYSTGTKTEVQPSAQMCMYNMKAYIEEVKGKQVLQAYPYCVLDEDHHVWYTTSSTAYPIDFCAEGNALYGVNVQKIYKCDSYSTYYAIDSEGKLWAWGNNEYGYLGNGNTTSSGTPVRVGTLTGITEVYASLKTPSSSYGCVIAKDGNGNIWAWGRNEGGIPGVSGIVTTPRQMTISGKNIIADKLNYQSNNSYVLCDDGSVYKANGTSGFQLIGTCEGATKILDSRINTNDNGRVITGSNKTWIVSGTTVTEVGNFEAVDAYFYGSTYGFIDTQGRYWTNESGSYAIDESVAQACGIIRANYGRESSIIDSNGHTHGYLDVDLSSIIKDMYGVVNAENAAKYANDLVSSPSSSNITRTKIINGQLWTYTFTPQGRIISYTNYAEWPNSDLQGKTIVEFEGDYAIDSEGQLYSLKTAKTLSGNEYDVTPASFHANNNVINNVTKNPVYGTKFKDVSNDIFATDVNNNVWYFPVGGTVKNISKELKGTLNPLYGKQIKKMVATNYLVTTDNKLWYVGGDVPKYVMDTVNDDECTILYSNYYQGSECVIGIDNAGKIYVAGVGNRTGLESRTTNGKVVCLNDVEGSPLNGVSLTTKAIDSSNNFVIIDTNGKVWMWGSSLATPTCITDKSTSAVHTAYENGVTMEDYVSYLGASAVKYTYLSDSTGELWTISSTDITKLSVGTLIGKTAEEKIVDITEAARLTSNGTLYVRYTPQVTIGGTNYAASTTKYRNVNELVTNVTIPQVTEIFDGYVPYASNTVTIANTVDGMYEITIKYNSSSPYGNYTIEARKLSTATVVKYFNAYGTYRYHHIYLDSNGDLWVSGYMGRLFNNTNTYEYGDYKMKCITTDSRSPLYNKKFTNVEKHGTALLGTTTTGELYFIEEYYTSYDTSPKLLDNDEVVAQVYGQENVDDAHKIKLFDEPGIVYSNGKFFNVQYGIRATETEKNWLQHYYDGIGIITEVVGEYDVKNSDGEIYRLTPTGIDTVTYEKVTESIPFSTATPDEAIDVPGATIVKQVKHKALDSKGNLYVWDTHTGLVDETEGVVCLTDTVNSIGPVYNEGNGWTVIQGSNFGN